MVWIDRGEKLDCSSSEGELVRAPVVDKVVCGGRLGTRLVSTPLMDRYDDGLPLHPKKQHFECMDCNRPV